MPSKTGKSLLLNVLFRILQPYLVVEDYTEEGCMERWASVFQTIRPLIIMIQFIIVTFEWGA